MENKRIVEIDYIRGFAIFLVVLGHSIIVFPINLHQIPYCKYLYDLIYSFHMPLFFAVSGYCYNCIDRGGYSKYLKNKIKRLLIPYFFFAFIGIAFRFFMPGLVNRQQGLKESIISIFLYGSEYWFLYTLFFIFLIAPIVYIAIEKNPVFTCIILFAFGLTSNYLPNIFCLKGVIYYLSSFVFGIIGKKYCLIDLIKEMLQTISLKVKVFTSVIVVVLIFLNGYCHYKINNGITNYIEGFFGIVLITILILMKTKFFRLFEKYSRYSLSLYVLNGYWLVISRVVIISILGINNPVIIITFNMLIDFYFSYIVIRCLLSRIPFVSDVIGITRK